MSTANLELLQSQATKLGLKYHHRAGEDKLRALIGEYLLHNPEKAGLLLPEGTKLESAPEETLEPAKPNLDYVPMTGDEYKKISQSEAKRKAGALRRIRCTNMNQTKKQWPGEIISVGSAKIGTFKKYIPFNNEPYHVPQIIYDVMKERMCSSFYTVSDGRGGDRRKSKLIPEYNIVDLPPLTSEELEKLAAKQQLAQTGL